MSKYMSVWDALEDDLVKRENLKLRSQLMIEINQRLDSVVTQSLMAELLHIRQSRISALRAGKVNDFRLDTLIGFATRLELVVSINIAA